MTEKFALNRLMTPTPEEMALYTAAGLLFCDHTSDGFETPPYNHIYNRGKNGAANPVNDGYTAVCGTFETKASIQKLSQLPLKMLSHISHAVDGQKFAGSMSEAMELQMLRSIITPEIDGFPFACDTRPFTWAANPHMQKEIEQLDAALKNLDIEQTLAGMELEFALSEKPSRWINTWEDAKTVMLFEITQKIANAEPAVKEKLVAKKEALKAFSAREILMYDLIERDERTNFFLEPLFGTGRDGDGYYDAEGTLELKIAPCDIKKISGYKDTLLRVLFEKASFLGLVPTAAPACHLNLSFWKNGQNLLDSSHPEFHSTGREIVEGLTKAIFDSSIILQSESRRDRLWDMPIALTVDRCNFLRSATGRCEIRFGNHGLEEHTELAAVVALASAAYGLTTKARMFICPAVAVKNASFQHEPGKFKILGHVLGNSIVEPDGSLKIPEEYVEGNTGTLVYELGLITKAPSGMEIFFGAGEEFCAPILKFLKQVRLKDGPDGKKIIWPKTSPNEYVYVIPAVNMDKLPEEMQDRLRNGEKIPHNVLGTYVGFGETIPSPEKRYPIDLRRLEAIQFTELSDRFVVAGYDPDKLMWPSLAETRLVRMKNSEPLYQFLSSPMQEALYDCIQKERARFVQPTPVQTRNRLSCDNK